MIYLITGVPGSGKSLYTVSTLIPTLVKPIEGHSEPRRLLVDGIPDLALDHVPLHPSDASSGSLSCEGGNGFANWPDWVQAGDVLVVDEVQRYLRPRSFGSKVPDCVQHLETHRHHGIDIVFITQNPMLIDQNIRRLVGRHQHVRRIWGFQRAMIYEWDGCQADVNKVSTSTKTSWKYPKDAFKLYKSSELHTKQKHNIPFMLFLPFLLLLVLPYFAYKAYNYVYSRSNPEIEIPSTVAPSPSGTASSPVIDRVLPPTKNKLALSFDDSVMGCVVRANQCRCFDHHGYSVLPHISICNELSERFNRVAFLED